MEAEFSKYYIALDGNVRDALTEVELRDRWHTSNKISKLKDFITRLKNAFKSPASSITVSADGWAMAEQLHTQLTKEDELPPQQFLVEEFAKYLETLAHPLQQMCHQSLSLQSWTKLNYANVLQRYVTREKNKFEGDCAIVSGLNEKQHELVLQLLPSLFRIDNDLVCAHMESAWQSYRQQWIPFVLFWHLRSNLHRCVRST